MVQQRKNASAIRSLVLVVVCTTMFAFSEKIGGDSFTIHLNDDLILQEHVTARAKVENILLTGIEASDVLKIRYSHCGKTGIKRSVAIQSAEKGIVKTWRFPDDGSPVMDVKVTEILAAVPVSSADQQLTLVYSSIEIPEGKSLAAIVLSDDSKASLK